MIEERRERDIVKGRVRERREGERGRERGGANGRGDCLGIRTEKETGE